MDNRTTATTQENIDQVISILSVMHLEAKALNIREGEEMKYPFYKHTAGLPFRNFFKNAIVKLGLIKPTDRVNFVLVYDNISENMANNILIEMAVLGRGFSRAYKKQAKEAKKNISEADKLAFIDTKSMVSQGDVIKLVSTEGEAGWLDDTSEVFFKISGPKAGFSNGTYHPVINNKNESCGPMYAKYTLATKEETQAFNLAIRTPEPLPQVIEEPKRLEKATGIPNADNLDMSQAVVIGGKLMIPSDALGGVTLVFKLHKIIV